MASKKPIKVGTVAITCGSKVPVLNDGVLVVVTSVGPPIFHNRYMIQRVDGQPLPLVGGEFYKVFKARTSGARLIPIDEDGTDNSLVASKPVSKPAGKPRKSSPTPIGVAA